MNLISEAQDVKNLTSGDINLWQKVVEEVDKPAEEQVQDKAIHAAASAFKTGIRQLLEFANLVKQSNQNSGILNKQGGIGDFLLGHGGFKLGIYMAVKNIYYGIQEYQKLTVDAKSLGLSWTDTINPGILGSKIRQYQDDPESMGLLARTTRSAKLFWDESISLVANMISSYKDFITALESGLPWAGIILGIITNLALEHVIRMIEEAAEKYELGQFDLVLASIKQAATQKIQELQQHQVPEQAQPDWLSELGKMLG